MLGIGKKKEKEELSTEKAKKDLKDLKPKNKKQRKEPPKPWGKKERSLVIFVVAVTAVMAGLLGLSSRSWKMPGLPRILTPDLALEGTYVLEADEIRTQEVLKTINLFREETERLSGVYGFYVARIYQEQSYGYLEDEQFPASNLMSIPLAISAYIEVEEGDLRNSEYKSYIEKAINSGSREDITNLLNLVGQEDAQEIISEIGMSKTSISQNITSPADMGKLLRKLWDRRLINDTHTDEMFEYLSKEDSEREYRTLTLEGRDDNVLNSAEIVIGDVQPYAVVIMSKGIVEAEADNAFSQVKSTLDEFEN